MNRKVKHRLLSLLLGIVIFTIPLSKATYSQVLSLENMFPLLSTISLTEKQQIQLEQLSQETVLKIKNVLTPPQQTQFFQGIEAGKDYRESLGPINMSEVQNLEFLFKEHADKNKIISKRLKILFTKMSIKSFLRLNFYFLI